MEDQPFAIHQQVSNEGSHDTTGHENRVHRQRQSMFNSSFTCGFDVTIIRQCRGKATECASARAHMQGNLHVLSGGAQGSGTFIV